MNCLILETENDIVVIDCGILFSDLEHFGVEFVIPDFDYLMERRDKVRAIIATHGHEDHIGALPFLIKSGIVAPIYASPFTSMLIREKLREPGYSDLVEVRTFRFGEKFKVGPFTVEPISVNHSIVDAAALIIDTPLGKIVHTGDFKVDPSPFYGSAMDFSKFEKAGDEGVLLLLSDSTNVERQTENPSEKEIYPEFDSIVEMAEGLVVFSLFASNVARMGQLLEICEKRGKKVALAGRTMEKNVGLARDLGYLKGSQNILIGMDQVGHYDRDEVVILSTGSQGEHRSALTRMATGEHPSIRLQEGDLVVLSSKFIPGNERAIGRMINDLFRQGAEVVYDQLRKVHVSGHATKPELARMLRACKPKFFLPVHGEYRHLVMHSRLARECGVKEGNVLLATNGDILELTKDSFERVDRIEECRVLVEGRDGNDVTRVLVKDRRKLAETGVMFSLLVRNSEDGKLISGPDILGFGIVNDEAMPDLQDECKMIVKRVMDRYGGDEFRPGSKDDLQEEIRIELRRHLKNVTGKKPVVLPIVLDL